jgi:hypothetical protein
MVKRVVLNIPGDRQHGSTQLEAGKIELLRYQIALPAEEKIPR